MTKAQAMCDPNSCLSKAAEDELIFVLRAADPCAPHTIADWCIHRVECGVNAWSDEKIQSAMKLAEGMRLQRSYTYVI